MRFHVVLALFLVGCASGSTPSGDVDAPPPIDANAPDACVPQTEICNNLDDDCDTNVDEDIPLLGDACTVGTGTCTADGHYVCDDQGGVICDASSGTPAGELCNGLDDDCDTMVDEGLGVGDPCDGTDSDACAEGVIECQADAAVCNDTTTDSVELCNGLDDDCQNGADDPWPVNQTCTVGVGACLATGTYQCNTTSSVACNATAGTPGREYCGDAIDSDCSGGADPTCPTNDLPGGAIDVSSGGTYTTDVTYAHDDANTGTCGNPTGGGRDVYYRFTLGAPEVVYLDTYGSDFDTALRVFSGSCTAIASQAACNDDACGVIGPSQVAASFAAGTYCVVVDQYSSSQTNGAVTLNVIRGGRNGTAISSQVTNATVSGTTVGGVNTQTSTSCQANAAGPDNAYFFTECTGVSRTVSASTCGMTWDTIITLRTGTAETACNDDTTVCTGSFTVQSSLTPTAITGPGLYWLVVDGYNGASGSYTMTYSN